MTETTPSLALALSERERQMRDDYDWALRDPTVQGRHGGMVVAVSRQRIWGSGRTHRDALSDAMGQPGCPPREEIALVPVEGHSPSNHPAASPSPLSTAS